MIINLPTRTPFTFIFCHILSCNNTIIHLTYCKVCPCMEYRPRPRLWPMFNKQHFFQGFNNDNILEILLENLPCHTTIQYIFYFQSFCNVRVIHKRDNSCMTNMSFYKFTTTFLERRPLICLKKLIIILLPVEFSNDTMLEIGTHQQNSTWNERIEQWRY